MSNPWKVTSNWIDNRQLYGVYRIIDVAEVEHSGNREFYGGYVATREEAATIAERLNAKEKAAIEAAANYKVHNPSIA